MDDLATRSVLYIDTIRLVNCQLAVGPACGSPFVELSWVYEDSSTVANKTALREKHRRGDNEVGEGIDVERVEVQRVVRDGSRLDGVRVSETQQ